MESERDVSDASGFFQKYGKIVLVLGGVVLCGLVVYDYVTWRPHMPSEARSQSDLATLMPAQPESPNSDWQRFLEKMSSDRKFAALYPQAEKGFYQALKRIKQKSGKLNAQTAGYFLNTTVEGLSDCGRLFPEESFCRTILAVAPSMRSLVSMRKEFDGFVDEEKSIKEKMAAIDEQGKGVLRMEAYMVAQLKPGVYEVALTDTNHVILVTTETLYQSKGWFVAFVKETGPVITKLNSDAGGFDAKVKTYMEVAGHKKAIEEYAKLKQELHDVKMKESDVAKRGLASSEVGDIEKLMSELDKKIESVQ